MKAMIDTPDIRKPVALGLIVLAVLFGGFGVWSAGAPLESAAIARGAVKVENNRKTVQHLEGGIVRKIHFREGDTVTAGDVVIELDQTKVRARLSLLEGQTEAEREQLRLIEEEMTAVGSLVKQGLAQKPRLLALQRRAAELKGNRTQLEAQIVDAEDALERTRIKATASGTIVGLRVHTPGGVITAGKPLMDIVPRDERLVIEASIDPIDIDVVRPGLEAVVYLTPYNRRSMVPLKGNVITISADQMTDERSGSAYYLGLVELVDDVSKVGEGAKLYPGMPVEVMIVTGKRTLFDMLIQPLRGSYNRAFREG